MAHFDIKSVALPAVGCGLGGLPYPSVELFVKEIFENDGSDNLVELYQPK
jgi:O-acetyl-ADP-ribose deacetylase (regulator of RNase III)